MANLGRTSAAGDGEPVSGVGKVVDRCMVCNGRLQFRLVNQMIETPMSGRVLQVGVELACAGAWARVQRRPGKAVRYSFACRRGVIPTNGWCRAQATTKAVTGIGTRLDECAVAAKESAASASGRKTSRLFKIRSGEGNFKSSEMTMNVSARLTANGSSSTVVLRYRYVLRTYNFRKVGRALRSSGLARGRDASHAARHAVVAFCCSEVKGFGRCA